MSRRFVCSECGKDFPRKFALKRHAQTHNNNAEKFKCAFPGCMHSSLQKSNVKAHYIAVHLRKKLYYCYINGCSRSFYQPQSLIRHEKHIHGFHLPENSSRTADRRSVKNIDMEPEHDTFYSSESSSCMQQSYDFGSTSYSPAPSLFPSTPSAPSPETFDVQMTPESYSTDVFGFPCNMIPDVIHQHKNTWSQAVMGIPNQVQLPSADDWLLREMAPELFLYPKASHFDASIYPFHSNFGFAYGEATSASQMPTLEGVPLEYSFASQFSFQ